MTDHSISISNWDKDATILLLPLNPQPYFSESGGGLWGNIAFVKIEDILVEALEYYPGDRIYIKQKWCEYDGEYILWVKPTCEVSEHEEGWLNWQPAETMPIEAAREWRAVKSVELIQAHDIDEEGAFGAGYRSDRTTSLHKLKCDWGLQHPEYPWDSNPWIVLLRVMPAIAV